MNFQRGNVVLVNFPFADGTGSKVRPALVVQADQNNRRLDNTILAQITSRIQYAESEPTQLLIKLSSPEGEQSGLLRDSAVSCENLFTVRQDVIARSIGTLPPATMKQIEDCLKSALGIE